MATIRQPTVKTLRPWHHCHGRQRLFKQREATTSYDLGLGASFVAGVNYTEDAYAGIDLTF